MPVRDGVLVFGRVTYDLMAGYWTTPAAAQNSPLVAKRMNELPKVVFSRNMVRASWQNTTLVKGDLADEIRKLKASDGSDLVILGSANLVSPLVRARLIDGYQLAVNAIVLGSGKSMFSGLRERLHLELFDSRTFQNGTVFLSYQPA